MSYTRVIPRDFFNEGKLMTCMGNLYIQAESSTRPDGINIVIEENGEPFIIEKDSSSGDIYVSNYKTYVNGNLVRFATNLNSRSKYPLNCTYDNAEYTVFTNTGEFDQEFIELCQNIIQ